MATTSEPRLASPFPAPKTQNPDISTISPITQNRAAKFKQYKGSIIFLFHHHPRFYGHPIPWSSSCSKEDIFVTIIAVLLYRVSPYVDLNWCPGQYCFCLCQHIEKSGVRADPRTRMTWLSTGDEGDEGSIGANKHGGNSIEDTVTNWMRSRLKRDKVEMNTRNFYYLLDRLCTQLLRYLMYFTPPQTLYPNTASSDSEPPKNCSRRRSLLHYWFRTTSTSLRPPN